VAVVLGLLVAGSFGTADFLGGRASRRASTLAVLLVAQAIAVVGAATVAFGVEGDATARDAVLGLSAGAANVLGLGLLYRGLATGRMGVVAPVTAVVGALVPIGWGLLRDERPSTLAWTGVALAVVAAGMLASERDRVVASAAVTRRAVVLSAVAGAALGTSFVCFDATGDGAGFWPVLSARLSALVLVALTVVVVACAGTVRFPTGPDRHMALAAGAFDVAAMSLLLAAVRRELAVIVAPIASLAPAFTVVLAWTMLHEPAGPVQRLGLVGALVGLALIAIG
jgi:drug/metabolite transporter (DMT)-like permease